MVTEARGTGPRRSRPSGPPGSARAQRRGFRRRRARSAAACAIEVISGEEEARLAYLAADVGARRPAEPLVVFDTGGGSSQFTFGHGDARRRALQRERRRGALHRALRARRGRLEETLDAALDGDRRRAWPSSTAGRARRARRDGRRGDEPRRREARPRRLRPRRRPRAPCSTAPRSTGRSSSTGRAAPTSDAASSGLQPGRADVILAGACIVRDGAGRARRATSLTVSDRGLRHGVLVERFGSSEAHQRPG